MSQEKLIVLKSASELDQLIEYLADKDFIAFDTETTGLDKSSEIIGFSVSADTDIAYYVVLSYWDVKQKKLVYLDTKEKSRQILEILKTKNLIMHNGSFDCYMVENNFQISLIDSLHTDTLILGHLLDENRSNGLKELGVAIFGENARKEQIEMKESVSKNGGTLTKEKYELYKADVDLLAKYGAKDAILTIKLFYHLVEELYDQGLEKFFYEDESMPLLRSATYQLNTAGLKVDMDNLVSLQKTLEAECMEAINFVNNEVRAHVKDKYPGTSKAKTFNPSSNAQIAWLLFIHLKNDFHLLTKEGKKLCKALGLKSPYTKTDKQKFISVCQENKGNIWEEGKFDHKTGKIGRGKKIKDPWCYMATGFMTLSKYADKYRWVKRLQEHKKNDKLLKTYVLGIQKRMAYGIIRPNFLQHGTTSGRYSCKNPNFQNLPRDDKRVKSCIVSRPGKLFIGADQAQLEPRVFTSVSQDERLLKAFDNGEDFYSVVGMPIFGIDDCSAYKNDENSFAKKHSHLRDISKQFALATPYGTTAWQQAMKLNKTESECQDIINRYFEKYPKVELMMLESHEQAKVNGAVYNLFGRPRRMPEAMQIPKDIPHSGLEYADRNLLNLAMNHRVQSTAASIMNRAAILFCKLIKEAGIEECSLVLQIHDELVAEGLEKDAEVIGEIMKYAMENAVTLPGVKLIADPKISNNLASLK
jgi:DNA polymerase I-like protein with 3'-5' exonuclease and polymerase domains